MNFLLVAGARPNFMKIAPLREALISRGAGVRLVHTGQHYDALMSDIFFRDLDMPPPDFHLGVGPGDRVTQTRKIIEGLLPIARDGASETIVVVGDVTSTAAAALAGMLAGIRVAHVEAGLRSFNWTMPEELNRMIADHHVDMLFVTDPAGKENLRRERIPDERIHFVGNIMIDSLRRAEARATTVALERYGLQPQTYGMLTLHRPENVDEPSAFARAWEAVRRAARRLSLIFPVHHRTRERMQAFGITGDERIRLIDPVGYLEMIALVKYARVALTDSGGLQEEATALGVPCLIMRNETERPVTVDIGTSEIVGTDPMKVEEAMDRVMTGAWKKGGLPDLWDGHAADRIAEILLKSK